MRLCYNKLVFNFAKGLCEVMRDKGISRIELAKGIGVSEFKVGVWCEGRSLPNSKNIIALSNFLNLDFDFFADILEESLIFQQG